MNRRQRERKRKKEIRNIHEYAEAYKNGKMYELNELLREKQIVLPEGLKETCLENIRRPLVLFRGKPITEEEVMELITGEESLFQESQEGDEWIDERGTLKNIFYRKGYLWLSTWVYTDGTIGGNLISLARYPELYEILPQYLHLAEKYPFLDMVISYTNQDENCCYWCPAMQMDYLTFGDCKCRDCAPYLKEIKECQKLKWYHDTDYRKEYFRKWPLAHVRSDVFCDVELTIWIQNGRTEVLFGNRARQKFEEYNKKYSSKEYDIMFSPEFYNYNETCICSKEYVERCFEYLGQPRSRVDERIKEGRISPFPSSAIVVTKKWVIEQYQKYLAEIME